MNPERIAEYVAEDGYPRCEHCDDGSRRGRAFCTLHLCEACLRPRTLNDGLDECA